jgi:uncharacterized protein (DUF1800 family)
MKILLSLVLVSGLTFAQVARAPEISDRTAARFLDQATWGPTAESIVSLQRMGIPRWLETQFVLPPSDLPDQPVLNPAGNSNTDLGPVVAAFFQNAVSRPDQLRQRVAFVLSQIWVVSQVSVRPAYAFPPYWRIFSENAFGTYRDIIKSVTLSPAMGTYLNMANNNKGNSSKGTAANENYARELMQLFTLGLTELNPDGSPLLDANRNPIPTYDQAAVTNLARALTGWTYPTAPGAMPRANNPAYYFGQMFAVEADHDATAKPIFNNVRIPAGQSAEQDLDTVLDALMAHPTMAPFVSRQLIQHMVTSNPSPAYVERAAEVFSKTRGDMKAVIMAILTDAEARAGDDWNGPENRLGGRLGEPDWLRANGRTRPGNDSGAPAAGFGHLREPILLMANLARGLNATVGATNSLGSYANRMGQNLFSAASVFSYFSPLNRIQGGLLGPEFQIYSTQTAATRADIISTALYGSFDKNTKSDLTPFTSRAGNTAQLLDYISYVFLHHDMPANLAEAAAAAANAAATPAGKAQAALYIVLTSGEYQVVH